jgi:hypothetical protein
MTQEQALLFEGLLSDPTPKRRFRLPFGPNNLLVLGDPMAEAGGLEEGRREYPLATEHRDALNAVYESYRLGSKGFHLHSAYYRYSGLTHTIRARGDQLYIRISHHFERQPAQVIQAIGHILLRKLLRLPLRRVERRLCREAELSLTDRLAQVERPARSPADPSRFFRPPKGKVYDLEEMAQEISERYFEGKFPKVPIYWSAKRAKRYWGKYYPNPPRIILNTRLDRPKVPRYVVEAVLYHEMLHHALGIRTVCGRKHAHTREFRRAERAFPNHAQAEAFLMHLR